MTDIMRRVEEKRLEIRKLQGQIIVKQAEIHAIQAECDHKNRHNYTVMGDPTQDCADCGKGFY